MSNNYIASVTGTAPWVHRVEEIKSSLAVNVEAERKVSQLNEEMQDLIRGIKTRVGGSFRYLYSNIFHTFDRTKVFRNLVSKSN